MLQGIKTSGERAAEVVSAMLTFSNTSDSRRAPCSLEALADKAIEMAGTEYNLTRRYDFRNISIRRDYAKGMPLVPCTETEIVQVFLNILRNAAQALCGNDPKTAPPALSIVIRRDGNHAVVRFADNGAGMPPSVAKRIFEPFYTTREPGEGTGLGLSVSYFIITRNHGGSIAVHSEPDEGTTISIRLPIGETDDDHDGEDNGEGEHGHA
jgi:signal transduction histidine kinase